MAIQAEWLSGDSYPNRNLHLTGRSGGLNGTTCLLPGTTVFDDEVTGTLTGGTLDMDWFIYNLM